MLRVSAAHIHVLSCAFHQLEVERWSLACFGTIQTPEQEQHPGQCSIPGPWPQYIQYCDVIASTFAFKAITVTMATRPLLSVLRLRQRHCFPVIWEVGKMSLASLDVFEELLHCGPICIGTVATGSLVGLVLPCGLGDKNWFIGPKRTREEKNIVGTSKFHE